MSRHTARAVTLGALLALSFVVPGRAQTLASRAMANATAATTPAAPVNIRIDNFGRVNANYFRGAQPKGRDFADLSHLGVKLVIDLAKEGDAKEQANAEREGMKFARIPLTTDAGPSQAVIDQFLGLVNDPANQPVYVHCMGGKHRTGTLTAVYRMTRDEVTADQAFKEMKTYHFGADFLHPELKSFVFDFYSRLVTARAAK